MVESLLSVFCNASDVGVFGVPGDVGNVPWLPAIVQQELYGSGVARVEEVVGRLDGRVSDEIKVDLNP